MNAGVGVIYYRFRNQTGKLRPIYFDEHSLRVGRLKQLIVADAKIDLRRASLELADNSSPGEALTDDLAAVRRHTTVLVRVLPPARQREEKTIRHRVVSPTPPPPPPPPPHPPPPTPPSPSVAALPPRPLQLLPEFVMCRICWSPPSDGAFWALPCCFTSCCGGCVPAEGQSCPVCTSQVSGPAQPNPHLTRRLAELLGQPNS